MAATVTGTIPPKTPLPAIAPLPGRDVGPPDEPDQSRAEDARVHPVRRDRGERSHDDRRPCDPDVSERIRGADPCVADVLADLEAEADECAEDEPVERAPDQLRREREEQEDARAFC